MEYILDFNCNGHKYSLLKATLQMANGIFWYRYVVPVHTFPIRKKKKKKDLLLFALCAKWKINMKFILLLHDI